MRLIFLAVALSTLCWPSITYSQDSVVLEDLEKQWRQKLAEMTEMVIKAEAAQVDSELLEEIDTLRSEIRTVGGYIITNKNPAVRPLLSKDRRPGQTRKTQLSTTPSGTVPAWHSS